MPSIIHTYQQFVINCTSLQKLKKFGTMGKAKHTPPTVDPACRSHVRLLSDRLKGYAGKLC